ncbi:cupin-like protein [Novosphingobium sp. PhB165]|uniref:cupin-like domain-containing protein n=1 Tax=Novosphingobium sp. PhB165 TaxID=2485105 RepID=UPI00104F6EEB|nr:cupin-like domain-containing protein [Novosphingobium sp. PhB165]TCM20539.1 cupin-like protein [Novosphingobium sp. PhB165]
MRRTQVIDDLPLDALGVTALIEAGRPVIVRGAALHWPLVRAGLASADAAAELLKQHDAGHPVVAYVGDPAIRGRYHYNSDLTGLNFTTERGTVSAFLDRLLAMRGAGNAPSLYIGSTDLDTYLPGLRASHDAVLGDDTFTRHSPIASIWIGNRTVAAAHWDMSNNMAVCVAGRRRFTLFPPDQVSNLYPGPIEPTPAGQIVSMVDPASPDFARYPRFADALAAGEVAELEPGDVLIYPALWWHQVESLSDFNVLINYWWNAVPAFVDDPMTTLLHGLLSLRERPPHEKAAWRSMFDHYVFGPSEAASAHLPQAARGPLAPLDPLIARRLRALIANRINR